jgi:hypothetical protein
MAKLRIGDKVVHRSGRAGQIVSTLKIENELLYVIEWRKKKYINESAAACRGKELGLLHG